jgi:hypothetical protein
MSDATFASPREAAEALAAGTAEVGVKSSNQRVCLGVTGGNGWFTMTWSADAIGTNDFVALYASVDKPDTEYLSGNSWYWASKANSYITSSAACPKYEARYLVWDTVNKKYVAVARTGAYPAAQCSS